MKPTTRFHNSDPWREETSTHPSNHISPAPAVTAATVSSTKLRLMCSNGGHIIPRPHDKSLCYIGGETRMVVVDRHITLLDLTHRLSKAVLRSSSPSTKTPSKGFPFTIKYQLPSEDLDSLISVTTDEDLEYMIDEYDNLNSLSSSPWTSSSHLRLFIFPTNPESVSSIGSGLESLIKSEDWFVNALNGANSGVSDTSSFNCLLNLDDDISLPEKKDVDQKSTDLKVSGSGQDLHSIPDSPMMETTSSSFGSASSTPSLVNLLPISDLAGNSDRAADPNDTIDQTARIQTQQVQNPACLLSVTATPIDSPRNQLHHQQPQFIPPPQYINQHHPSGAVPVASYYQHQPHQPPTDQQNFIYYMPARQLPRGYNFPQPSYDAPPAATAIPTGDQTILNTELPAGVYRTNAGASQHVRGPYVGYSEIHQPSQVIYYATQAMPRLSAAHYKNMASMSPFETSFQEQVRTALP